MKYYIFASDPHGTGKPWIDKVQKALNYYPTAQIVFGGDYIDGRKYSKETVDYIMKMCEDGHIALLGNHEDIMLDTVINNHIFDSIWKLNGYKSTIKSFCGRDWAYPKNIGKFYHYAKYFVNWARELPIQFETENIIFVHAGLDLSTKDPINDSTTQDKLWIRDDYFYENKFTTFAHNTTDKVIVTGHTPTCLIYGDYDDDTPGIIPENTNYCPVKVVQYKGEKSRIFTDGGCHSGINSNTGNVVILNELGVIEKIIS